MKARAWKATAAALVLAVAWVWGSGCGGDGGTGGSGPDGSSGPGAKSDGVAPDGATTPDGTVDASGDQASTVDGAEDAGATDGSRDGSSSEGGSLTDGAARGDGGCALLYGGGEVPGGFLNVAVDSTYVYFLTADANPVYHMAACPKTGCGSAPTLLGHAVDGPVALDSSGGIYWMDQGASGLNQWSIRRCAGLACGGGPTVFNQQGSGAIVAAAGRVYWVMNTYIATCTTGGGCAQQYGTDLFYNSEADGDTSQEPDLWGLATDSNELFWVQGRSSATGPMPTLYSSPLGPTGVPKALFSDYTLADSPLTTNASSVFWTTVTGSPRGVYACPKSGCAARTTIYSNPNGFYDDAIAADDQNVYFAQKDTASTLYGVYRCPVTGCTGAPSEVMPTVMSATALALDDTTVYIQAARETAAGAVPELWACPK